MNGTCVFLKSLDRFLLGKLISLSRQAGMVYDIYLLLASVIFVYDCYFFVKKEDMEWNGGRGVLMVFVAFEEEGEHDLVEAFADVDGLIVDAVLDGVAF